MSEIGTTERVDKRCDDRVTRGVLTVQSTDGEDVREVVGMTEVLSQTRRVVPDVRRKLHRPERHHETYPTTEFTSHF